jgi:hypothetical protein
LKGQVLLGGEAFVGQMTPRLEQSSSVAEIPKRQRRLHRPALKTLWAGVDSKAARNEALARAYLQHAYTLVEIGRAAGLHYATVSRIIKAMEEMSRDKM